MSDFSQKYKYINCWEGADKKKKSADQVQKEQAHIAPSIEHTKHWSMLRDVHMCRLSAYIPQSIIDRKKMC